MVGGWRLVVGGWGSVVGGWWLVVGWWLVGCRTVFYYEVGWIRTVLRGGVGWIRVDSGLLGHESVHREAEFTLVFCTERMYERWIRAQPPQVFIMLKREMGWEGGGTMGKSWE